MNKDELVKIININELNPKDTTEKLFCVAIIKNCSSYQRRAEPLVGSSDWLGAFIKKGNQNGIFPKWFSRSMF